MFTQCSSDFKRGFHFRNQHSVPPFNLVLFASTVQYFPHSFLTPKWLPLMPHVYVHSLEFPVSQRCCTVFATQKPRKKIDCLSANKACCTFSMFFFFFEIETGFRFMYCCSICGGVRQVCVAHSYAEVETIYYDLVVVHTEDRTKSGGRSACFSSPYSCFFHKSFLLYPLCRNDIIVIRRLHRQTGSTWTWIALNSICT